MLENITSAPNDIVTGKVQAAWIWNKASAVSDQNTSTLYTGPNVTIECNTTLNDTCLSNTVSDEDTMIETIRSVYLTINLYWYPVIVPIGLVGNILTLIVILQKRNRNISCYFYIATLAVVDSVNLLIALYNWISTTNVVPDFQPDHLKPWLCKSFVWLYYSMSMLSVVLILALSVDRIIVVKVPLKASSICTTRRSMIVVLISIPVCIVYNIPYFYHTHWVIVVGGGLCSTFAKKSILGDVYSWMEFVIKMIIPFVALVMMNTMIVQTLRAWRQQFNNRTFANSTIIRSEEEQDLSSGSLSVLKISSISEMVSADDGQCVIDESSFSTQLSDATVCEDEANNEAEFSKEKSPHSRSMTKIRSNPHGNTDVRRRPSHVIVQNTNRPGPQTGGVATGDEMSRKDAQLAVMLTVVTSAFLLLTLPQYVRFILFTQVDYAGDALLTEYFLLMYHITQKLYFTNSAINFYLYIITGSKFRRQLKQLFQCQK